MNGKTESQKRAQFCGELGNLLNVYIFNEEITSEITLDASKSAEEIKKSYDELVNENRMLRQRLADIRVQAARITDNAYYQRHIVVKKEDSEKKKHLSVVEKAQNDKYVCCNICDRFLKKSGYKEHTMTDVCLSIRVSKELSKKSINNVLAKKRKEDLIVAFRNVFVMKITFNKKKKKYEEFLALKEKMDNVLLGILKKN